MAGALGVLSVFSVLLGFAVLAMGVLAFPAGAAAFPQQQATDVTVAAPVFHKRWGTLADLAGREWIGNRQRHRFVWSDAGRTLTWEVTAAEGTSWSAYFVFTESEAGIVVQLAGGRSRGAVSVDIDGTAVARVGDMGGTTRFVRDGEGFQVVFRPIPVTWRLEPRLDGWTGQALQEASGLREAAEPAARRGPIVIAQAGPGPASAREASMRGRWAEPSPAIPAASPAPATEPGKPLIDSSVIAAALPQLAGAPAPAPVAASPTNAPIVLASTPPPPAAIRAVPLAPAGAAAPHPVAPTSREALMATQIAARREQVAREAEAERQRRAQIAEAVRIAEANRRAQAAADAASRNEMFGLVGAVLGGVVVGSQTGGDMAGISAGMALGSSLAAPESEIAAASQQIAQAEMQRLEEQRAREAAIIAEMNNPNNPLTQEARRRDEARKAQEEAEKARIETELNERREEEDRQALLEERMAEAEENRERQAELRDQQGARDAARQEQQRREEAQRERNAQQAREEQERRQEEERQRREQADREAEARRQEQERQRAAAEAERTRVIDFKEAVVLCSLSGPQAQFNNWRCEGPLQMTYVNFEQANVGFHFDQMSCASYRELPRAGPYRAFGCGYGLHPTSPGASRNVPEMLGVFVDGRITFRCPRNISGVCRSR